MVLYLAKNMLFPADCRPCLFCSETPDSQKEYRILNHNFVDTNGIS